MKLEVIAKGVKMYIKEITKEGQSLGIGETQYQGTGQERKVAKEKGHVISDKVEKIRDVLCFKKFCLSFSHRMLSKCLTLV